MIALSNVEEETLRIILDGFVVNDNNFIKVTYDIFPQYIANNIKQYLDLFKYKSLIANYYQTLSDIEIYLTPDGINYFTNKKKQLFPKNSMDLLRQLLEEDNPVEYMRSLFKESDNKSDSRLRAMMRDLKEKDYIITSWADNVPYFIEFNEKAYTVNEVSREEMQNRTYIINNITNGNANINSTDKSVRNTNISYNSTELFEKMLEAADTISDASKDDIIMAIEDMKNNYNKPSLKEKYYKFIEVAANYMTLFAPFIPAITELAAQYTIM